MFKTKVSVDRHVQELFRKVRDEKERNLRCYNIAKLYYQVGDYESARRYVASYLEIKNESAGAHKLLGQIYEALEQKENAFAEYKQSLELDGRQDDLVLKVCELLADVDVEMDVNRIKYWVDRATEKLPNHPIVFELKEKMLAADKANANDDDLEALITSELLARPSEVQLRVKLIKYYVRKDRLKDAFKHAIDVEVSHPHRDSLIWYETLCDLLPKCRDIRQTKIPFWILYISSLERYAALTLREHGNAINKTIQEAIQSLFILDQCLLEAKQQNYYDNTIVSEQMFSHMWGQLNYHLACLLMRKNKREQKNWVEVGRWCSALLLSAIHSPPIDLTSPGTMNIKEPIKGQLILWHKEGAYRCSQAAHILKDYAKDNPKRLMDKIDEHCTGQWREFIYRRIFIGKSQEQMINNSYFAKNNLPNPPLRLLSLTEVKIYDDISTEIYPASLHHHVWIGIANRPRYSKITGTNDNIIDIYPNQYSHVFPNLQLSIYNLDQAAPDSLGRLDIDAFLNATILCAVAIVDEQQRSGFLSPDRIPTLPADLTNPLCSSLQEKWWQSAYKIYTREVNVTGDYGELRQEIQRGLEVIRCIGNHGLHLNILVHLARLFYHRAELLRANDKNHSDLLYLQMRYELYWSTAVPLLERLLNNHSIRMTTAKMFDYQGKDMSNAEMANALDEGRLILAQRYLRKKEHEQAIEALQVIKTPEASYLQGEIYKTLADELMDSQPRENLTSAIRSQHIIMLTKARNCYYLTLDRLRSPGLNPNHPLNAELGSRIESIENDLKRIDPDLWRNNDLNRHDYDALSEESYSSAHSAEHQQSSHHLIINNTMPSVLTPQRHSHHRTPKQSSTPRIHHHQHHSHDAIELSRSRIQQNEARPSPERLDAQLRQLIYAKDNMLTIMMDQIKSLVDSNKSLMDSNKQLDNKLEDLRKEFANFRIETQQKRRSRTNNIGEQQQYLTEDDYNEINFSAAMNNSGLSQPSQLPPPHIPNNLFAQAQHNPYTPLVYPPPPPPPLASYYPGGLPFNDPHTQHMQSLYPQGVYPIPPIFPRPPIDQTLSGVPKIPDMIQQGMLQHHRLFASNLMNHLTDLVNTAPVQQQQQSLNQPQQNLSQTLPMQLTGVNLTQSESRLNDSINIPTVPTITSIVKDAPVNKAPPVNVVITTSDTLPTHVPTIQPTLSVTIPPQHRNVGKMQNNSINNEIIPHNYQISMPLQAMIPTTVYLPPLSASLTNTIANTHEKNSSAINSSIISAGSHNSSIEAVEVEYDPIPGFVPVIPLPAEVKVRTGEEDEETLFCARAKLFRFADKEWKDRGVGNVKLLRNNEGKIRLLMRREQVLKICANHLLTPDMNLQAMNNNDKAWIWVANDFADEEVKLEKLCIKFKLVEEAQAFKEHFDNAKRMIVESPVKPKVSEKSYNDDKKIVEVTETKVEEKSPLVVGGFTFKSPPIIQPIVNDDEKKKNNETATAVTTTASKPSPFAGFSFTKSDATNQTTTTTSTTSTNLFSFVNTSTSNAVETPQSSSFTTSINKVTNTTPVDLSAGQKSATRRSHDASSQLKTMFTPINGTIRDDGKAMLYENTVTLLRRANETGDWNERGVGSLFILLDIKTGKLNLVIWNRERGKAFCNQPIVKSIEFTTIKAPKYICWQTHELNKAGKYENYAMVFKETNDTELVRQLLNNCQRIMIDDKIPLANININGKQITITEQPSTISTTTKTSQSTFSDAFKPPPGSWECKSCYTRNTAESTNCVACTEPSECAATPPVSATPVESAQPNNMKSLSELFKPKIGSWECQSCYIRNTSENDYCLACNSPSDPSLPPKPAASGGFGSANTNATSFSFGIPQSTNQNATPTFSFGIQPANQQINKDSTVGGFTFKAPVDDKIAGSDGQTKPMNFGLFGPTYKSSDKDFLFGGQQKTETPSTGSFAFGTPGKNFDFQFQSKSPGKSPGGGGSGGVNVADVSEDEVAESEDVYFAPVIPLPDKIEVKTGEEDEEVLYTHRAKLFRFDSNTKEWKERGLGDIKLLRHCQTKKLRLVMRRDQTLKLCLNHVVNVDLEMTSKDEKTWSWNAADFSEGEIEYVLLACRFKTSDIAADFKQSVESAIADAKLNNMKDTENTNTSISTTKSSVTIPTSVQDVQVVYQLKVTPEEKDAALKLQLPENFYSYKQKDDCPGCIGCKEPDHPIYDGKNKENEVESPTIVQIQPPKLKVKSSITATPSNITSPMIFGDTTNNSQSSTPIFGAQPTFNSTFAPKDEHKTMEKSNFVFGESTPTKFDVTINSFGVNPWDPDFKPKPFNESPQFKMQDPPIRFGQSEQSPQIFGDTTNKSEKSILTTSTAGPFGTTFGNFGGSNSSATYTFGATLKDTPPSFSQLADSTKNSTPLPISTAASTPMFKGTTDSTTSLFSGMNQSTPFGVGQQTSIFSGVAPGAKSLFGGTTNKTDSTTSTTTTPSFPNASGGFLQLGKSSTETTNIFGSLTTNTPPSFGNLSGNKSALTTSSLTGNKVFGDSPSIFGGNMFGNVTSSFGMNIKANDNTTKSDEPTTVSPFLNTENITTFSTLAATGTQPVGFKTDPNFSFAGAGQSVFGAKTPGSATTNSSNKTPKSTGDDGDAENADANNDNEEYDPHYEPIIPLPDAVEVRTGEEDEEKIFSHRAKLYRYEAETKEWKERGTGEMKLLYHPEHCTYRLLLRREQVHKVVCNLLITPEIEFQPLKTSDRTWMWAGMNYTDETFAIEKLAVKFKSPELADEFKNFIDKAQNELREKQNNSQSLNKTEIDEYKNYHDEEEDDGEDEEGDDEEEEQTSLMFEKPTVLSYTNHDDTWSTFGSGQLKILYDPEIFGARIIFEMIPGEVISSTVISIETEMELDGTDCTWAAIDGAVDPPIRRTLKAHFDTEDCAREMFMNFQDGQECARQADISEAAYYDDQEEP